MNKMHTSKKIAVDAYFFNNFGDDLFLEILINRYPNASFDFITPSEDRIKNFADNPRIKRVSRKQALANVRSYDLYLMIGGSMFQQPPDWKMQWVNLFLMVNTFRLFNKKTAVIGCNFGPFEDPAYVKAYSKIFKKLNFMSVRDEQSFNLLQGQNINLHLYPDMAFSFDVNAYLSDSREEEKCIGVSIMDFGKENDHYENKMVEIISSLKEKAKVKIFSFQNSAEISDLNVINHVLSKVPGGKQNIQVINYDGNMKEFLGQYATCESFLTTRFHSLIISLMFNQHIVAINYNPKIKNTLEYLKVNIELVNMDELDNINVDSLINQSHGNYELTEIVNQSISHFQYLDSVIRN